MSGATSRFLTYELGKGNIHNLNKTFSSALLIHFIIAIIVVLLAETVGLWFLYNKLVISEERIYAAQVVYQLSIISAVLNFTQVPYNSCIIAHEKMDVYAYVEMLNVLLKLLIVYLLGIGGIDKLILYSVLVLSVSAFIMLVYRIYCVRHFEECRFKFTWDKEILKPLLSFSGWNMYTSACYAGRQQGFNFILNMFGGAVLNSAASLAATVDGIITGFAYNVVMAFRPPLIKMYAVGDKCKMENLLDFAVLISFFLYFVAVIPLIVEADFILSLWLGNVPAHTVQFLRIVLIASSFSLLNSLLVIVVQAVGEIKVNSIITGTISFFVLLPLYFLLKKGYNVDIAYGVMIISNFLISVANICCIRKLLPQMNVVSISLKALILLLLECAISYFLVENLNELTNVQKICSVFFFNLLFVILFLFGVSTKEQKMLVYTYVRGKIRPIK